MITEPRQNTTGLADRRNAEVVLQAGDLFRIIRRRLSVILLTMIVCVAAAVAISLQQTPLYEASIKILVGQDRGILQDPSQAYNIQLLTVTLGEAVDTRPVAQGVIQRLNLKETSPEAVMGGIDGEVIPETQFIKVTFTDPDPQQAQRIVNAIGDEFSEQISMVSPAVSAITATVWERAAVPESPKSPNPVRNGLIAAVLGILLGVGLAVLLEFMDDSWQSPEEVEHVSGVPNLGVIPGFANSKSSSR
jgi:capsular polysaccharide biosynthesis protein